MTSAELDISVLPIGEVATDMVLPGFSPRLDGQSEANVELLCATGRALPPILLHRPTNRVIDGMHRLLAARRRGQETIAARYVDGDEASAFVLAVSANVAHGLPLPLRDRKVAAARILGSHAHWSNRRIALAAGLSDKTVAAIRARIDPRGPAGAGRRVGLDERARPVDGGGRRSEVARLLAQEPGSSLRRIAARAGVSPETVRSVKAALGRETENGTSVMPPVPQRRAGGGGVLRDPRRWLHLLVQDPALRSSDTGRLLLRLLSAYPVLVREADRLVGAVPPHALADLHRLAAAHAEAWRELADRAAARVNQGLESAGGSSAA